MQLLRGRTAGIDSLAISPDSRYVAVRGPEGCHAWDLCDPKSKPRVIFGDIAAPSRMQFASETALLARGVRHWSRYDFVTETESAPRLPGRVRTFNEILHPTRGLFKAVSRNESVETFRVTAGGFEPVGPAVGVPYLPYLLMCFDATGDRYLVETRISDFLGRSWHLFDTVTDILIKSLQGASGSGFSHRSCHFSPDGRRMYVTTDDHLCVFDCEAGGPPVIDCEFPDGVSYPDFALHPDGRILATVENEREVTFRDAETLQAIRTYDFNITTVTCVAFTPDGTRCVLGNSRGKVLLFDVD